METANLGIAYQLAQQYLLHPRNREAERIDALRERIDQVDEAVADPLRSAGERDRIESAREYVETLELAPPCPLYVGTYMFDEPESCRGAAVSDRNPYLLHLENLYRHFGFELVADELPDFLPIMLEFLRITEPEGPERDVALRKYFVREFLQPGLEPMHEKLLDYESPYAPVLEAIREAVDGELEAMSDVRAWEPDEEMTTAGPTCGERLDTSSLPCCGTDIPSQANRTSSEETVR